LTADHPKRWRPLIGSHQLRDAGNLPVDRAQDSTSDQFQAGRPPTVEDEWDVFEVEW
jgi:hypothetical protein